MCIRDRVKGISFSVMARDVVVAGTFDAVVGAGIIVAFAGAAVAAGDVSPPIRLTI